MLFKLQLGFGSHEAERLVSVDIGTSTIKVMELEIQGGKPFLVSAASGGTPAGAITNHTIVKVDAVAEALRAIVAANDIQAHRATFCLPGPCAFSKRIQVGAAKLQDLETNIVFEAANYIPHKIDAVHLDYQVLRALGSNSAEVLLVAVKNEIIASYLDAVEKAGLEPVIADIDYFALENMFELNYPEEKERTIALVNIGARYSSVNILQNGLSLFTGDVGVGGRLYTDALCEQLKLSPKDAELAKLGHIPKEADGGSILEMMDRTTDHVASELHRQIGFFWNAAAAERSIEAIFLSGGTSVIPGLKDQLSAKAGLDVRLVEAFRGIDTTGEKFDAEFLQEMAPSMCVSVGLASRRLGDKKHAIA